MAFRASTEKHHILQAPPAKAARKAQAGTYARTAGGVRDERTPRPTETDFRREPGKGAA